MEPSAEKPGSAPQRSAILIWAVIAFGVLPLVGGLVWWDIAGGGTHDHFEQEVYRIAKVGTPRHNVLQAVNRSPWLRLYSSRETFCIIEHRRPVRVPVLPRLAKQAKDRYTKFMYPRSRRSSATRVRVTAFEVSFDREGKVEKIKPTV